MHDGQWEVPNHHHQFRLERPLPGGDTDPLHGHAHQCAYHTLPDARKRGWQPWGACPAASLRHTRRCHLAPADCNSPCSGCSKPRSDSSTPHVRRSFLMPAASLQARDSPGAELMCLRHQQKTPRLFGFSLFLPIGDAHIHHHPCIYPPSARAAPGLPVTD